MAKKNCTIYGPDLSESESEGARIAEIGLKCMKGVGTTSEEEKSDGPDASRNNLEKLK